MLCLTSCGREGAVLKTWHVCCVPLAYFAESILLPLLIWAKGTPWVFIFESFSLLAFISLEVCQAKGLLGQSESHRKNGDDKEGPLD